MVTRGDMLHRTVAIGVACAAVFFPLLLMGCNGTAATAAKVQPLSADAGADATIDAASTGADVVLICPGAPGCPCTENGDCDIGVCIDDPVVEGGKACARSCVDVCPGGYKCANVSVGGSDVYSICVPRWGRVCDPCTTSTDCDSLGVAGLSCVDQGDIGMYCGSACAADGDCPSGYGCKNVSTAEGGKATQCVRLPGSGGDGFGQCPCSTRAVKIKLSTSCAVPITGPNGKPAGSCKGNRTCTTKGLSECVAAPPEPETCNGLDDNCNGLTDEGSCDDNNACTLDNCDGKSACSHKALDGTVCDDGSACTDDDKCQLGVCIPGSAKNCDDKNICTKDQCDAVKGCAHTPDEGAPCDDDNACTLGDVCAQGQCQSGVSKVCKSPDGCTKATCGLSDGKCSYAKVAEGTPCDDGVVCTDKDTCNLGVCAGVPMTCDDGNVCTVDSCDAKTGCTSTPQGKIACDDGNPCTLSDQCQAGQCIGTQVVCDDKNPCTSDACNAQGTCTFQPKTAACDDGDPCTTGDHCVGLACVPGSSVCACKQDADCPDDGNICNGSSFCDTGSVPYGCKTKPGSVLSCDDSNACTTDSCDPTGGCSHVNTSASCSDGNGCTVGDACGGGKCVPGANTCQCATTADCAGLEDGNLCNGTLTCNTLALPYKCVVDPKTVVTCTSPAGTCAVGTCTLATGACSYVPQNNGQSCNADNSVCTVGDVCSGGTCVAGAVVNCDDGNACTGDSCNSASGCTHASLAVACSDGNACTVGDVCSQGTCSAGNPKVCSDGNVCTTDSCSVTTGACSSVANAAACDDGNPCSTNDTCAAGACKGVLPVCGNGKCECGESALTCAADCATPGMVVLPAGTYVMGSPNNSAWTDEKPQHQVTLSAFELDKTEVTVAQYAAFYNQLSPDQQCNGLNSGFVCGQPDTTQYCNWSVVGKEQHPVNCVDWYQANAYCVWAHKAGRLPTEAEWEYAARSGGKSQTYPWGEAAPICTLANSYGCNPDSTKAICSTPAGNSSQGACDLAGNALEWCSDWYGPYSAGAQINPTGPSSGDFRVLRGGSWWFMPDLMRSAYRAATVDNGNASSRSHVIGFRCARTL